MIVLRGGLSLVDLDRGFSDLDRTSKNNYQIQLYKKKFSLRFFFFLPFENEWKMLLKL